MTAYAVLLAGISFAAAAPSLAEGETRPAAGELRQQIGEKSRTEADRGFQGSRQIDQKDPHYGWDLGQFFVSGYTRVLSDASGTPVFLKNVGDEIRLSFLLLTDPDSPNGQNDYTVTGITDGYDLQFETPRMNMGQGTLLVRYTDWEGVRHDPEIVTDYIAYLSAEGKKEDIRLFEEGDYEIALDYRLAGSLEIAGFTVPDWVSIPNFSYADYRIAFSFKVRNGNCMVYPFDLGAGSELSDGELAEKGFRLDLARSRYLNIDVRRETLKETPDGYEKDLRFNRPARDGDQYTEEGIYTFKVTNLYTGEK